MLMKEDPITRQRNLSRTRATIKKEINSSNLDNNRKLSENSNMLRTQKIPNYNSANGVVKILSDDFLTPNPGPVYNGYSKISTFKLEQRPSYNVRSAFKEKEVKKIKHERTLSHNLDGTRVLGSITPLENKDKSISPLRDKLNYTKTKLKANDSHRLTISNGTISLVNAQQSHIGVDSYNSKGNNYITNSYNNLNNLIKSTATFNTNNYFKLQEKEEQKYLPKVNQTSKMSNKLEDSIDRSKLDKYDKHDHMSNRINNENIHQYNLGSSGHRPSNSFNITSSIPIYKIKKDSIQQNNKERELTPNSNRKIYIKNEISNSAQQNPNPSNTNKYFFNSAQKYSTTNQKNLYLGKVQVSTDEREKEDKNLSITNGIRKPAMIHKYAFKSKQGMNYDGTYKTNQDSFMAKTKIFNLDNFSVFGVFDGHGMHGHFVSNLIKLFFTDYYSRVDLFATKDKVKQLETKKNSIINYNNLGIKEEKIYEKLKEKNYNIIKSSYYLAETALSQSKYETNFSGATCVMVLIVDDKIICANAGDSRAILVTEDSEQKIIPLSRDHKPELKEEAQRIVKCGGRVDRYNDNGVKAGPFRVWLKNENFPGLAMSRSVGDFVAESVGVICEPEIFEYNISGNNCKYIVIASDGIWEFLSNEKVAEIVNWYYKANDPSGAAEKLIEESIKKWKLEDDVVDDTTAVVIFFNKGL